MPKKRATRAGNFHLTPSLAKDDPSGKRASASAVSEAKQPAALPLPDPKRTKEAKDVVQEFITDLLEFIKLSRRMN